MKKIEWLEDNRIKVETGYKPKKITGTRFGAILGANAWSTPFQAWCEITRTYEEPFEDTIYTIAGKVIEPKQADYMKLNYFCENIQSPTDKYGADYFKKTFGDFFKDEEIFGGMWDYLDRDEDGKVNAVFEMKTTKRAEDWNGKIPEYYKLQASLYAYLLGVDQVYMVASFLTDKDYEKPENYSVCSSNTIVVPFKVSEEYPNFREIIARAIKFWNDYVVTGISPQYDEKLDANVLKELRNNTLNPNTEIDTLLEEYTTLSEKVEKVKKTIEADESRLAKIKDIVKDYMSKQFGENDKATLLTHMAYEFKLTKTMSKSVDSDKLKADGIYENYLKDTTTYRFTVGKKEK